MKKNKEVKAVIYARTANDPRAEIDYCIECQISECLDYCDSQSFTVVGGYFDVGSAVAVNRHGLDAIYDLLLSELVDVLVVTSFDRLFRTRNEALEFAELLRESGVTLHVCGFETEGASDLESVLSSGMSTHEAKVRSQKAKAATKKKAGKTDKVKVIPKGSKKK